MVTTTLTLSLPETRSNHMPFTLDPTYEPRLRCCGQCGRVLGVVMRDTNRVRRLWVFSMDRAADEVPDAVLLRNPPRGMFKVHGLECASDPGGVECTHCGCVTSWDAPMESFERLMSHYQDGKK